jgi:hypothetical protein
LTFKVSGTSYSVWCLNLVTFGDKDATEPPDAINMHFLSY